MQIQTLRTQLDQIHNVGLPLGYSQIQAYLTTKPGTPHESTVLLGSESHPSKDTHPD